MPDVVISFVDVDAKRRDVGDVTLFAIGLNESELDALTREPPTSDAVERIVRANRNATVVVVTLAGDDPVLVEAWRGMLAGADLYYATPADGSLIVSDHFRNAVCRIPIADRAPEPAALVEHYLCGWVYDTRTLSRGVDRLGMGNSFAFVGGTGSMSVRQFDRIEPIAEIDGVKGVVERVAAALEESLLPISGEPDVAATFSGGVDSTLLATFLEESTPLVAMTTDTPEFAVETAYAKTAAGLMGRTVWETRVAEQDYLDLLVDLVDTSSAVPHHYVMPMLAQIYTRSESTFILGEGADSVFGTDRGLRRIAGALSNRFGLAVLGAGRHLPGRIGFRFGQVLGYASDFAIESTSTSGAAGRSLLFGDPALVTSLVGEEAVDRVISTHLDGLLERVELEVPFSDRFNSHMEMIRWRHTLADLATIDRQIALPHGKRVVFPYLDASVIDELRKVPATQRYVKGLAGKWVLKEMLGQRLPDYPVNQRKNATGLPFERFYLEGPLRDIWNRYDVPEFFPADRQSAMVDRPSPVTWYAISHAIWSDRVERNADLTPLPSVVEYLAPIGVAT